MISGHKRCGGCSCRQFFYSKLTAKPSKSSGSARNANAVHDFTHAMLTYLQTMQVPPMLYVQVASTFLEEMPSRTTGHWLAAGLPL